MFRRKAKEDQLPYNDIIEWDIENWSKALAFWTKSIPGDYFKKQEIKVLALGERNGGLTLWLGLKGIKVICSDYHGITEKGKEMHRQYGIQDLIEYQSIDINKIGYSDDYFDFIICKSVIGGLKKKISDRRTRTSENQKNACEEIRRVLKKDGYFMGSENMKGSFIHTFFRNITRKNRGWKYLSGHDISYYFSNFRKLDIKRYGFFGAFIKEKSLNRLAGKLDSYLNPIVPDKFKYISFIVAKK